MKKYLYLLRKKYSWTAIILLLVFSSCTDKALEETPLDFLAPENAYNTVPGIRQGISGLHFSVRDAWFGGDNQDQFAMLNGCGTDVAFHGENPGGNIKLVNYLTEMTPANSIFTFFCVRTLSLIHPANRFTAGIEASEQT